MNDETRKLVFSARNGDLESFGTLATQFYPALTSIAYSLTNNHHLAEDAAQEALARALTSLRSLRDIDRFGAWLAGICRNVARDMIRQKAHQPITEEIAEKMQAASPEDKNHLVAEAVNALPAAAREIIVLRYYNNLSYEQISDVLDLSKPAINGRLKRAKKKIAVYLKQNGYPEI